MSVMTAPVSLVGSGTVRLPRVNLLPPEIAEQKKARRIQMGLGAVGVGAVVVVGALYLSATHSVTAANSDLQAAQEHTTQLQGQVAQYGEVTAITAAAATAQQQLVTAMGDEVRYSQLLNDLSLSVPSNVWLKSLTYAAATPTAPGAAGAAGATTLPSGSTAAGAVAPVATFTVTGIGFSHEDVALWLESIAGLNKTYANPYFSNSTEALMGTRKIVNFTSTATVVSTARSGRYTTPAGS
jgi:Tfp pilus assembly protein PilN